MLGSMVSNYWITWFPGACLALVGLLAIVYKGLRTLVKVQEALPTLYEIHAEFSPNSGHSMKDRVESLHDNQEELASRFRKHVADDERHFNKLEATLDRIEDKL